MSTSCIIIIRDKKPSENVIKLFHRQDGYPKGVGKFLLEEVIQKRLEKCEYYTVDDVANFLVKNEDDRTYMVTGAKHPDSQYRYFIFVDTKEILCQQVHYEKVMRHFELTVDREIDLKEELKQISTPKHSCSELTK